MNHLVVVPVLLPMFTAVALVGFYGWSMRTQRLVSMLSTSLLVGVTIWLVLLAGGGELQLYRLGNWAPPFGIVLILDRLSAMMLCLTAVLAWCAGLYACRGDDRIAAHFHALFQFQLMGLGMAFLTGDLFNLFVAFEILLIASYALLVHGVGAARSRAGLHYVVLNLIGSAIFLLAVGILYGLTGTLNMADLARSLATAPESDHALLRASALLLLVVFGLKAAALPLLFWLPRAYVAATAPVAALFAIMTKVGIYAAVRVYHLIFGSAADPGLSNPAGAWLWPVGLATIAFGVFGLFAAKQLKPLVAYLVIVSSGTLLVTIAHPTPDALAAALFYLVHSTLVCAALFLLADQLAQERASVAAPPMLAILFLLLAASVAGIPPFSGFLAKLLIFQGVMDASFAGMAWAVILVGALGTLVALSRAGSRQFWLPSLVKAEEGARQPLDRVAVASISLLLLLTLALTLFASVVHDFTLAAATQIMQPDSYIGVVLPTRIDGE